MGWICQHCGAPFFDSAYRVKSGQHSSRHDCLPIAMQARNLGLPCKSFENVLALKSQQLASGDGRKQRGSRSSDAGVGDARESIPHLIVITQNNTRQVRDRHQDGVRS
jgi:hypothetical protein